MSTILACTAALITGLWGIAHVVPTAGHDPVATRDLRPCPRPWGGPTVSV